MRKYQREMGKVFEEGLEWNFKEDLNKVLYMPAWNFQTKI